MIRQDTRDGVRLLFLSRPQKRNALDTATAQGLVEALAEAAAEEVVRAVVLAADGPGFCAGADLGEIRAIAADPDARAARSALSETVLLAPGRIGKPVVAAVHGAALGAGAALALGCDAMLMAPGAKLGFPEARHGMLPALMAPVLLRHLPPREVFRLLATGDDLPADEAQRLGLCANPVPEDELLAAAVSLAASLATLPPPRMLALKRLCAAGARPLEEGFAQARALREEFA
ncbi:enoyl-CoA hydratase/isomerase family protein [Pseudoroseomonas ludipueritiae]|uniref:Enoyl-CoA hydratase/isomerase family protein n=1 Tax=Pseudoroseomonas ludipueritiae TaxID=198093 RepID=A0ABR7R4P8_9PROT|nr:enoyl-CoA hydratase-related protein [Pseudoroseomonas ludipueritiae]MBC9176638.1 enoyl-CoA hydratase/isomerase family protein [Pseudoroseomonas ludipueritiae]